MGWSLWVTWDQVGPRAMTPNVAPTQTPFTSHFLSCPSADQSNAQCIPAPLATPIPVSDDPASPEGTPCTDLSESPSSQGLPPMPYSVPVSEHMDECSSSVIKDELDSLLECIPKKVSEVSGGQRSGDIYHRLYSRALSTYTDVFCLIFNLKVELNPQRTGSCVCLVAQGS